VNALASVQVANYLRDRFVATTMKVGTFQIVATKSGERKVGGNVASYFCMADGTVVHAVPGPANETTFLNEARWAWETRRLTLTQSTDFVTGEVDKARLQHESAKAHGERFQAVGGRIKNRSAQQLVLPAELPQQLTQQAQVHWLLATRPAERIDQIYPIVWEQILGEQLSGLPVAMRN